MESPSTPDLPAHLRPSLCLRCLEHRLVRTDRGSLFVRCAAAEADRRLAKYPPQPVVGCPRFAPAG